MTNDSVIKAKTKGKRGIRLAILGLLLGLALGVAKMTLEASISELLVDMLREEAVEACNCDFKVDSIDFSLLRLKGEAHNARLTMNGEDQIRVPLITAHFNPISHILGKRIAITSLILDDAEVSGVSPESGAVRFIGHLAKPLPQKKKEEFKIRVRLLNLEVRNGDFFQPFGSGFLHGNNVGLQYHRDERQNIRLTFSAERLKYQKKDSAQGFSFGKLESSMYITDDSITFQEIALKAGESIISFLGELETKGINKLHASMNMNINGEDLPIETDLQGVLTGSGTADGKTDALSSSLTIRTPEDAPITIIDGDERYGPFTFLGELSKEPTDVPKIISLESRFEDGTLKLPEPMQINANGVTGTIALNFKELELPQVTLLNGALNFHASAEEKQQLQIEGAIGGLKVGKLLIPKLQIDTNYAEDKIQLQIRHQKSSLGSAMIKGTIATPFTDPEIDDLDFTISNLALLTLQEDEVFEFDNLILFSANGSMSGKCELELLKASGDLSIAAPSFIGESALRGPFRLESGNFNINLENSSSSLTLDALIPIGSSSSEGKLKLSLTDFKPQEYQPELSCISTSLVSEYNFSAGKPYKGDGSLNLSKLSLGCAPYQTDLSKPVTLQISDGAITFPEMQFRSENSKLKVSGEVTYESIDLKANGTILLRSLLPIAPALDDLSGTLKIEVSASGDMSEPIILGSAVLTDGAFALESGDLSASSISGQLELTSEFVSLKNIEGNLNGGSTQISGALDVKDITSSALTLHFDQIYYEIAENTHTILSGDLTFGLNERGLPLVGGEVEVNSAEFIQEFDVRDLVSKVSQSILTRTSEESNDVATPSTLPPIELDVAVKAPRNIIIITSFLGTELAGDLLITGDLSKPKIEGKLETLRGWLGLREARFEITSGAIEFSPEQLAPQIAIIAESYVRGGSGENILVLLEVDGSLIEPNIQLTSDQGNSEREILSLLGTRSDFRISSGSFEATEQLELGTWNRANENRTIWEQILKNVTTIDALSLEPKFNARRGQLEPALVAQKSLAPKVDLVGESFLSSPEDGSQVFLRYRVLPKVQLLGSIDTINAEERTSFGADIAFTVLSRESKRVDIQINGNEALSANDLLDASRISFRSRIDPDSLESLRDILLKRYEEEGYRNTEIDLKCHSPIKFCETLLIQINEGLPSTIGAIELIGDEAPAEIVAEMEQYVTDSEIASGSLLDNLESQLSRNLRSDGYLQARIQLSYEALEEKEPPQKLKLILSKGNAITIQFIGNDSFSERRLLETINLFERKQPFGNNTIHILARNIERLYRENGFLLATVHVVENESSKEDRTNYTITIREEDRMTVSDVRFLGTEGQIKKEMLKEFERIFDLETLEFLLYPDYAISEEITRNTTRLKESLNLIGFPDPLIRSDIVPKDNSAEISIHYHIHPGERHYAKQLKVLSHVLDITLPKPPSAPYSVPKANQFMSEIIDELEGNGYFESSLWSEIQGEEMLVHIEPGQQEIIEEIEIIGNIAIKEEEILRHLNLEVGQPLKRESLQNAKRSLLRLGLFSRVDSKRIPISSGKARVEFILQERSLQTLEFGGGVNSEFGLHLFGEGSDRELFADGRSLSLRFDTFYDDTKAEVSRGLASLRYTNPTLFDSDIQHSEDLRFQRVDLNIQEFDLNRFSLASFLAQTDDALSWSFGHNIFIEDLDDVTPGAILDESVDTGNVLLSMLNGTLNYDQRDSKLNPQDGYAARFEGTLAHEGMGSDASYVGLDGRVSYLAPLQVGYERFGFASSLRGAGSWGLGTTDTIPITQRYYLGGRTTVRGFRENSLGPRGEDGAVIGGDLLVLLNTELRYYPSDIFSIHLFLDSGTVYLRDRSVSFDDIRYGSGVGFRYLSPIGPVGFDVGAPLDERSGEPSIRLHFSIGSTF